ncbi:MAG: 50S ribosomal protein L5 [Candidatus Diapherotrites archaeon]|nr:50S ribosomal protein L5 [Candidatus Diapherotrites archaeon]
MTTPNPMQRVFIAKVTLNMGVGQTGEELKRAEQILQRVSNHKTVQTICKVKQPEWGIREGIPIGVKTTLRGGHASAFLKQALQANGNELNARSFDRLGNFGFGVKEYIDLPGAKYDPKLGIRGLDVLVTLEKPGYRVKKRKVRTRPIGKRQLVGREEAIEFVKKEFGVKVV